MTQLNPKISNVNISVKNPTIYKTSKEKKKTKLAFSSSSSLKTELMH